MGSHTGETRYRIRSHHTCKIRRTTKKRSSGSHTTIKWPKIVSDVNYLHTTFDTMDPSFHMRQIGFDRFFSSMRHAADDNMCSTALLKLPSKVDPSNILHEEYFSDNNGGKVFYVDFKRVDTITYTKVTKPKVFTKIASPKK